MWRIHRDRALRGLSTFRTSGARSQPDSLLALNGQFETDLEEDPVEDPGASSQKISLLPRSSQGSLDQTDPGSP